MDRFNAEKATALWIGTLLQWEGGGKEKRGKSFWEK